MNILYNMTQDEIDAHRTRSELDATIDSVVHNLPLEVKVIKTQRGEGWANLTIATDCEDSWENIYIHKIRL